jgi:phenylacetate-CoA ligase
MLAELTEQIECVALRNAPEATARVLGALPPRWLDLLQRARFRRTMRLAARAPFYRDAFRTRGIDPARTDHPSQLGDFFTTGEDIRIHGPEAFAVGRPETAFETTGTTSPIPKRVVFSNRELNAIGCSSAAALHLLGVRRDDVVVSAFDCSFWVSPAVARSALQYIGCFHVEAGKIDPGEFYDRSRAYKPTIIFGEPSWIVRLSEIASERGAWPLKLLLAGGENIAETARHRVQRIWNAPLYLNYGQTEAFGSLGIECREQQGYHRNDLHFLFEIDRPDPSGAGELIYTTLTRDVMPLIRYRSSDVTRFIDERCGCGLFIKRIEKIRARADEMVVCGMGNVGPWVFEELLRGIEAAGSDWQAVLGNNGRVDTIELRVETTATTGEAIENVALSNLRERFPDFWKNLSMRLYEFRVTCVPIGGLRTGRKLRRIVDERQLSLSLRQT